MGELPREGLAGFQPAFTNTAVDYFGPFLISYDRGKTAKRYRALFVCLTKRAVYLELEQSFPPSTSLFLSTDS